MQLLGIPSVTNAYIVSGANSSGNRLLASILVRSGCRGEGNTNQPTNEHDIPESDGTHFAMIAQEHLGLWSTRFLSKGYDSIVAILIIREPVANGLSMVKRGHWKTIQQALDSRQRIISDTIRDAESLAIELHIVTYEGLSEPMLESWLPTIGLPYSTGPLQLRGQHGAQNWITNENAKHYQE